MRSKAMAKRNSNLSRKLSAAVALLAMCAGCGGASAGGGATANDEPTARATLTKALDAWVAGTTAADLRMQSPEEIIAIDQQWISGAKLADYELVGTGQFDGKNFRFPARLTYKAPPTPGAPLKSTAEYVVGLHPVVTVSRVME
jgi:hypothetical protein